MDFQNKNQPWIKRETPHDVFINSDTTTNSDKTGRHQLYYDDNLFAISYPKSSDKKIYDRAATDSKQLLKNNN